MGFMGTTKFLALGARSKGRKVYFRKFLPAHAQWALMKNMLNDLVLEQRLECTSPKAKELQQYAEELIFLAKKNTPYHDGLVESILTSPEARRILYERMVPRYRDRGFHFTRIVNQWRYRERDTAPMSFIEYVDRPGEIRPANPVGAARDQLVAQEFLTTRRGRRKHATEVERMLRRPGSDLPLDEEVIEKIQFETRKLGIGAVAIVQSLASRAPPVAATAQVPSPRMH